MESVEKLLQSWAATAGFGNLKLHDGLCDYQNLTTGMVYYDDPLESALDHFRGVDRYTRELEFDALQCHVDLTRYDVFGSLPCHVKYRTRRKVCLLHTKEPCPVPWALKTPDGTRAFHDFYSMADFAVGVYGRRRPLTPRQDNAVAAAYHDHIETGKPFVMPEV